MTKLLKNRVFHGKIINYGRAYLKEGGNIGKTRERAEKRRYKDYEAYH